MSLCTKEVIEDGGVEGLDTLLVEIVVVSLDLGALAIMGLRNQGINQTCVFFCVLAHFNVVSCKIGVALRSKESIELFFLVT